MSKPILVYDESSSYPKTVASAFKQLSDDVVTADWNDETVQEFLELQFGWKPCSMMVVTNETVYVGEEAQSYLTEVIGVPAIVSDAIKSQMGPVVTVVSQLIQDSDSDNVHGEFPLDSDASDVIGVLRQSTGMTEIPINEG